MKNKKIIMYLIILIIILFIIGIGFVIIYNNKNNNKKINEYVPVKEITEEQLRQTNIVLYFYDNNKNILGSEIRKIDVINLIKNPEKYLIKLLIEGPKNNELIKLIPEGTSVINTEIKEGILYINFSDEFIKNKKFEKEIIIESINKTLSELNEINKIKILVNGKEI